MLVTAQHVKARNGTQSTTERQPASKKWVVPASSGGTVRTGEATRGRVLTATATTATAQPRWRRCRWACAPSDTLRTPAMVPVARASLTIEPPAGVARSWLASR